MNDDQRLHLQNMITENGVIDQTHLIRELKHSHILRNDINALLMLIKKHKGDADAIRMDAMVDCKFLFTYYTDIYNKIRKNEIDLTILFKFIDVLESIETGRRDQHEASFEVGSLLKQIYVDSALRKAEKLNAETDSADAEFKGPQVNISWRQFKHTNRKSDNSNT